MGAHSLSPQTGRATATASAHSRDVKTEACKGYAPHPRPHGRRAALQGTPSLSTQTLLGSTGKAWRGVNHGQSRRPARAWGGRAPTSRGAPARASLPARRAGQTALGQRPQGTRVMDADLHLRAQPCQKVPDTAPPRTPSPSALSEKRREQRRHGTPSNIADHSLALDAWATMTQHHGGSQTECQG